MRGRAETAGAAAESQGLWRRVRSDLARNEHTYLMLLPVALYYLLFHYQPMYGAQIAFKNFSPARGIWGSAEGLIDPDFASTDPKGFEAKIVGDKAGAHAGLINGHMGRFYGLKKNDPNFARVRIQPPVRPAGKPYGFFNWPPTGGGLANGTICRDPVAAMKKMGIDDALKTWQAIIDRDNAK